MSDEWEYKSCVFKELFIHYLEENNKDRDIKDVDAYNIKVHTIED